LKEDLFGDFVLLHRRHSMSEEMLVMEDEEVFVDWMKHELFEHVLDSLIDLNHYHRLKIIW
jgi:hypothetical protein